MDRRAAKSLPASHVTPNRNSAHLAHLDADWEQFYRTRRSSATRRRDRSKLRHMSQFGDVRFVTTIDSADARRTLEILMEQKGRALARKGIGDLFAPPGHREFFLDLAANPSSSYLVHISGVEIGATCAAANLGIVFGDRYYHVLASYVDGAVAHYGPGALHLRELLAYAIRQGLKAFDFTIGDEPYKLDWCDTVLRLYDYAAATRWRGVPARALLSMRRRGKRLIKQTPLSWRIASHARNAMGVLAGVLARAPRQRIDKAAAAGAAATPSAPAASWATWTCCGRWRSPQYLAPSSAAPARPRSIRATRLRVSPRTITATEPNVSSSFWWRLAPLRPNRRSCSIRRTARPC